MHKNTNVISNINKCTMILKGHKLNFKYILKYNIGLPT